MSSDHTARTRPQYAPRRRYSSEDVLPREARIVSPKAQDLDRVPAGAPRGAADDEPRKPRLARRKSILVDPDETSSQRATRRGSRSRSQVRIQAPPDDADTDTVYVDGHYVRHRDGNVEFVPNDTARPRRSPLDLERKTDGRNRQFREKRDDYESDEGEKMRSARQRRAPIDEDDEDDSPPDRRRPRPDSGLPRRERPRRERSRDDEGMGRGPAALAGAALGGVSGAAAGAAGGAVASHRSRDGRDGRDGDSERRRRPPVGPRDDYDDDYPPPRRRQPSMPPSYAYPESRGNQGRGPRGARPPRDDDQYERRQMPRRREADDFDRRPPPRSRRYDDYDSYDYRDAREAPRRAPRRARSFEDDRGPPRRRDARDDKKDPKNKQDWTKAAGAIFMTQAMPVIKKEGGKFITKQVAQYMAKR
ncbi:MAG: hypothetical protein M1828_001352 [Chrysothrix sp. TS-e1954]|nr:MAG: hypothetical protein M1828_001352 [Chrysothrix sp. TS-e1954]